MGRNPWWPSWMPGGTTTGITATPSLPAVSGPKVRSPIRRLTGAPGSPRTRALPLPDMGIATQPSSGPLTPRARAATIATCGARSAGGR